jgi:hypothetical protein
MEMEGDNKLVSLNFKNVRNKILKTKNFAK